MPDKLVTLATFSKTYEAELARNRLEAEGIAAHLSGEASADLWTIGTSFGTVQLQVAEADLERAGDILDSVGEPPVEEAVSPPPADAIQAGWICSRCGADVSPARDTCPSCGAPADDLEELTPPPSTAISPVRRAVLEGDEEDPATRAGDHLAARAFRAAVMGLWLCPPFVYVYSLWLLVRLFAHAGELSPAGTRRLYGALAIHAAVVLVVVLLLRLA
ncbi:MAG TPA: DUF2007 domain-containing protein [Gemmataceae bacterium]|jgi:hypothetical protein|nr:DUF2007 domain-containing protein [Gemmataceae bacterium]